MTVKDQNGKIVFSKNKEYEVSDFHLAENKEGYLGLNNWDMTAMKRFDLGLEPYEPDSNTFIIPLRGDTTSAEIEASVSFLYEPGKSAVINKTTKKIDFKK